MISIVGSGNVAFHLAKAFQKAGVLDYVALRKNSDSINYFSEFHLLTSTDLTSVKSQMMILAVTDKAINSVLLRYKFHQDCIIVHTSGSTSIDIFQEHSIRKYGCVYPLQTLSITHLVEYSELPIYIEGSNEQVEQKIESIVNPIFKRVGRLGSEKRIKIHLASVIASNFSNHLLHIAKRLLQEEQIEFDVLRPLVIETIGKSFGIGPGEAQTGPAIRGDREIIEKHKNLLDDQKTKDLYGLISEQIMDFQRQES